MEFFLARSDTALYFFDYDNHVFELDTTDLDVELAGVTGLAFIPRPREVRLSAAGSGGSLDCYNRRARFAKNKEGRCFPTS